MQLTNVNKLFFSLSYIKATDVNAVSVVGETALHIAVSDWTNEILSAYGHYPFEVNEMVVTLLKCGADLSKKGSKTTFFCGKK